MYKYCTIEQRFQEAMKVADQKFGRINNSTGTQRKQLLISSGTDGIALYFSRQENSQQFRRVLNEVYKG